MNTTDTKIEAPVPVGTGDLLCWLEENAAELVAESHAIGDTGDFSTTWVCYEHHGSPGGKPKRVPIGCGNTPAQAIRDAMLMLDHPEKWTHVPSLHNAGDVPRAAKKDRLYDRKKTRKPATKPKRKSRSLALGTCSPFLAWFEEQAGKPRLNEADYLKLMHETVPSLRAQLASAERELAEANRYRTAKQYALYAWCAKDSANRQ